MPISTHRALFLFFLALAISDLLIASGQTPFPAALSHDGQFVTLSGNVHPLANPKFDRGAAPQSLSMDRMLLVLKRNPEQDTALRILLDRQHDSYSPNYHRWLTPAEFGEQFGISNGDIAKVVTWLQSEGFQVDRVSRGRTVIEFSGNVDQVQHAFHTTIHEFVVNGQTHWANISDPQIPAALTSAISAVASLHNFRSAPQVSSSRQRVQAILHSGSPKPQFTSGKVHALAPADYAVIYNLNPLLQSGINGSGTVIAVVGRSNINVQDVISFRSVFNLPSNPPRIVLNGPNPGDLGGGEELEAVLDTSWAGATAPNAQVDFVVSASTNSTDGVMLSEEYVIDNNLANVMTESFGDCEANYTQGEAAVISSLAQQAASQGITYTVAAGDAGSAGCDNFNTETAATGPVSANILAATPYTIAVGGTQFNETGRSYWSASNGSNFGSALSYIPEDVWNANCTGSSCSSRSILAGGGGRSTFFMKPAWQTGVSGIPNDGARDLPDVSLISSGANPYLLCLGGSCTPNQYGQISFYTVYGTSASAPSFAGIISLVNQKTGSRQGQANTVLYPLAAAENLGSCNASNTSTLPPGGCIFNDVTVGTNAVPGEPNYNTGTETYLASVGYDRASGLGSVNAANLVNNWRGAKTTRSASVNPSAGTGSSQTFTYTFTDSSGASDIFQAHILMNSGLSGGNACYFMYQPSRNDIFIANDAGNAFQAPLIPGGGGTLSNSQCSIPASGVVASLSGTTLTLTAPVSFKSGFAGAKNVFIETYGPSSIATPWTSIGTWTVPAAPSGITESVNPASGSGSSQRFTFSFNNSAGASNFLQVHMLINSSLSGLNACYLMYTPSTNKLFIANNAGSAFLPPLTAGGNGVLSSSACTVSASSVSTSLSGNTLTVSAFINFSSSFAGGKTTYVYTYDNSNKSSPWNAVGNWNVP